MAKTVLLSGLIAPAPIYHPAMAAQDGPFAEANPAKKKKNPKVALLLVKITAH